MSETIKINGEKQRFSAGTVLDLLRRESIDPARRGVAVALNGRVVARRDWSGTRLQPDDEVEIVKPFAGG